MVNPINGGTDIAGERRVIEGYEYFHASCGSGVVGVKDAIPLPAVASDVQGHSVTMGNVRMRENIGGEQAYICLGSIWLKSDTHAL